MGKWQIPVWVSVMLLLASGQAAAQVVHEGSVGGSGYAETHLWGGSELPERLHMAVRYGSTNMGSEWGGYESGEAIGVHVDGIIDRSLFWAMDVAGGINEAADGSWVDSYLCNAGLRYYFERPWLGPVAPYVGGGASYSWYDLYDVTDTVVQQESGWGWWGGAGMMVELFRGAGWVYFAGLDYTYNDVRVTTPFGTSGSLGGHAVTFMLSMGRW